MSVIVGLVLDEATASGSQLTDEAVAVLRDLSGKDGVTKTDAATTAALMELVLHLSRRLAHRFVEVRNLRENL